MVSAANRALIAQLAYAALERQSSLDPASVACSSQSQGPSQEEYKEGQIGGSGSKESGSEFTEAKKRRGKAKEHTDADICAEQNK